MWQVVAPEDQPGATDSPCTWAIEDCCELDTSSEEVTGWATQMAASLMYVASGRQYGTCEVTLRPCSDDDLCDVPNDWWTYWPYFETSAGAIGPDSFMLLHCGRCAGSCECESYPTIRLPHRKIVEVSEVVIDGEVLDPSAYRLNGRLLLRLDGGSWPTCQDWGVENGEVGSWSVTYSHGRRVPPGGAIATGMLRCELIKACSGDGDCLLPRRVQEVTRQGVTAVFTDPMEYMNDGLFGIFEIDAWVLSVNPKRLARAARVIRPDEPVSKSRIVRP